VKPAAPGGYAAHMASGSSRDDLLGRLLAVPLDRFVEQRNRLARELREAGDKDTAAWLAKLRRPSPGVWALDQMARGDARRVRGLLDLGAELAQAQAGAVQGDREAVARMRDLGGRLQRAVDDVVRRAAELLRDAGHGATTDTALSMASTLRGAIGGDEETRRALAEGRLLEPVEEGGGFGFGLATDAPPPAAAQAEKRSAAPRSAQADQGQQRLRELRRHATETARAADAAERELAKRRDEAGRLHAEADEVRARIRALDEELGTAEERARQADAAAEQALAAWRAARRQGDAAQAALPPD
jgi:hypothetical protein